MVKCIKVIYEIADFSKIGTQFTDPMLSSINTSQQLDERVYKIYVLTKVFQTINKSCFSGSPPTKEILDALMKIGNKTSDAMVKIQCYKGMTRVLKGSP